MDSHHFQVLHDTQELYDCRRLNQSIITSEVTYSIAAVATFFLTLIINPLLGEESRFGYTYPEVVPEVQLKGPTLVNLCWNCCNSLSYLNKSALERVTRQEGRLQLILT